MSDTPSPPRPPRFWRWLVVALFLLPLLPEAGVLIARALAHQRACLPADEALCVVAGIAPGALVDASLDAGLFVAYIFALGGTTAWMALTLYAVIRGFARLWTRLFVGAIVSFYFAMLPVFAPMIALDPLGNPRCRPNEGGAGPCFIYGYDVGNTAHEAITLGWFGLFSVGQSMIVFPLFIVTAIVLAVIGRRRAATPALSQDTL